MIFQESIEFKPGVKVDHIFNVGHEIEKTFEALRKKVEPEVVMQWLQNQVKFVLSEFGVGEMLALQPPNYQLVRNNQGVLQVMSAEASAYGDQLPSFLAAQGFPEPVREGLFKVYTGLAEAQTGEGFVRYSPTEFYQHLNSITDVLEIYRVIEAREDGSRLVEGRYVLLNVLPSSERAFVINWHNLKTGITAEASPDLLIASPQKFPFSNFSLRSEDPVAEHMSRLEQEFLQQFGHGLMYGDIDKSLYALVENLAARNIHELGRVLINGGFIEKLKALILLSQAKWARFKGIDPIKHLGDIFSGRIILGGSEGILSFDTDQEVLLTVDRILGLEKERSKKQCSVHGDYDGDNCPQCTKM